MFNEVVCWILKVHYCVFMGCDLGAKSYETIPAGCCEGNLDTGTKMIQRGLEGFFPTASYHVAACFLPG